MAMVLNSIIYVHETLFWIPLLHFQKSLPIWNFAYLLKTTFGIFFSGTISLSVLSLILSKLHQTPSSLYVWLRSPPSSQVEMHSPFYFHISFYILYFCSLSPALMQMLIILSWTIAISFFIYLPTFFNSKLYGMRLHLSKVISDQVIPYLKKLQQSLKGLKSIALTKKVLSLGPYSFPGLSHSLLSRIQHSNQT